LEAGGGRKAILQRGVEKPAGTRDIATPSGEGFGIGDLRGVSGGFGGDIGSAIQSAIGMQQQAIQPAVESLQAQKSDLQAQYDTLLSDVLGREEAFQARELGARGITPSSSLGVQQMGRALSPLQERVRGAQSADEMAINNAIARLQAQAGMSGISTGTDIYGMMAGLQQQQFAQQLAQQQQALAQRQFGEVTLPMAQYELGKPYYKPEDPAQAELNAKIASILENVMKNLNTRDGSIVGSGVTGGGGGGNWVIME